MNVSRLVCRAANPKSRIPKKINRLRRSQCSYFSWICNEHSECRLCRFTCLTRCAMRDCPLHIPCPSRAPKNHPPELSQLDDIFLIRETRSATMCGCLRVNVFVYENSPWKLVGGMLWFMNIHRGCLVFGTNSVVLSDQSGNNAKCLIITEFEFMLSINNVKLAFKK